MRINSGQRDALLVLYGTVQMLERHQRELDTLSRGVKNGYRDLRMILTVANKLLMNVLGAVDSAQLPTIQRHLEMSEIRVTTRNITGKTDDDWLMPRDDIAQLVEAATAQCLTCDNTTGEGCWLSKAIDELPVGVTNTLFITCKGE